MTSTARALRRRVASSLFGIVASSLAHVAAADSAAVRGALGRGDCAAAGVAVNEGLGRNDPEAFFLAGFMYDAGQCVEPDPSRAARLYRRAASLGNTDASAALGLLTGLGRGVPQDYAEAHRLFRGDRPAPCDAEASADVQAALGYGETIAQIARRRVSYPTTANSNSIEASVDVVVSPASGAAELQRVRVDAEVGSRLPRTHDFTDPIEAAYREAQAYAPRPALASGAALRVVTPWRFIEPRDVNNQKLRLEGVVTLGDTCLAR